MKARIVKRYGETSIIVDQEQLPYPQAEFAMRLMQQLAIAAATPDGESSDGRQKLRLLAPAEVAVRACEITAIAFNEFKSRGWLLNLPVLPTEEETTEIKKD